MTGIMCGLCGDTLQVPDDYKAAVDKMRGGEGQWFCDHCAANGWCADVRCPKWSCQESRAMYQRVKGIGHQYATSRAGTMLGLAVAIWSGMSSLDDGVDMEALVLFGIGILLTACSVWGWWDARRRDRKYRSELERRPEV